MPTNVRPHRIGEFVAGLRQCRESVGFLGLTLYELLSVVVLPDAEVPLFVGLMRDRLGLASQDEQLAGRL